MRRRIATASCHPSKYSTWRAKSSPRLSHAIREAQQARFEHGEDGAPAPYRRKTVTAISTVYIAGSVLEKKVADKGQIPDLPDAEEVYIDVIVPWRCEIAKRFGCLDGHLEIGNKSGRFRYGGPTLMELHGDFYEELADNCIEEVCNSDAVFAWIDRADTIGTIAEIGAAYARRKPIFLAFNSEALRETFYFARQLTTAAIIAPDIMPAWQCFVEWMNRNAEAGDRRRIIE